VDKRLTVGFVALAATFGLAGTFISKLSADNRHHFKFQPDSIVLSRSVYMGTASTVAIGETLPRGCAGGPNGSTVVAVPTTMGGTTNVTVPCGIATDNGEAPNLSDPHNVWNNSNSDGSFGVTSPIFLDNLTSDGWLLETLPVPSDQIVTSLVRSRSWRSTARLTEGPSHSWVTRAAQAAEVFRFPRPRQT
jgi:hypothetical protein